MPKIQISEKKSLFLFICCVFLISAASDLLFGLEYTDITMFLPGFVAIFLTLIKKESIKSLFRFPNFLNFINGFLLSVLVFAVYLIITFIFHLENYGIPKAALAYFHGNKIQFWTRYLLVGFPLMLGINFLFAAGEELGWRGYLLPKIKPFLPHFWARALTVGIIWGAWHVPMYVQIRAPGSTIFIFLINICLISICYTWLYERKNSIWPTALAHGAHNAFFNTLLPGLILSKSTQALWVGEEGLVVTFCYSIIILFGAFITMKRK